MSTPPMTVASSLQALLRFAWDREVFTANDAIGALGLSRSTTIEGLNRLVTRGRLRELPNAREAGDYRKGRPSRRFTLREDAAVVVGVDAGQAQLLVTVADLRGAALVSRVSSSGDPGLESATSDETRRAAISDAVDAALADAGVSREAVASVCVGVPAPVHRDGRSPAHPGGFWQRMNPDLRTLFSWAPVVRVENDASLASVAEHAVGACVGLTDTVTLLAGRRLGAGVVVDGHLLRGHHGGVGELVVIRHLKGVETVIGLGDRVAEWARDVGDSGRLPADHPFRRPDVTAQTVFDLAAAGDGEAIDLVERVGHATARLVGTLGSLFDPSHVVVAGGVAEGIEPALVVARELLAAELDLPTPVLVASNLGADVVSVGAVAAAVEAARDHAVLMVDATDSDRSPWHPGGSA